MKTFTIEITAKTASDAEMAIDRIRTCICSGSAWDEDEDGNSYSMDSQGEFEKGNEILTIATSMA